MALVAVAGCSDEPAASEPSAPAACQQRDPTTGPGQDVEGTAVDATLWALPFAGPPFRAGQEVKVVWRMTGSGPPSFEVTGPDGADPDALLWGPAEHPKSNWDRPGDEWGTGLRFAEPGCWRVTVRRDVGSGSVWFTVAPNGT